MSLHFVTFETDHMLWLQDVGAGAVSKLPGMDLQQLAEKAKTQGPCLTLMEGEEAIACGGIVMLLAATAEIWLRLSRKAGPHAVRELRAQMYRWIESLRLNRLQASGPTTWKELPRFLEWLGMQSEGILRKYGPNGEDYFMYSWVRECQP